MRSTSINHYTAPGIGAFNGMSVNQLQLATQPYLYAFGMAPGNFQNQVGATVPQTWDSYLTLPTANV
ncbi:MAG: hypothetical protein ACREGF_00330, partial [Candidatus Saccharimonadales bacterium]